MYILVVTIPLISAIISGIFGRFIGTEGAKRITTISISITSVLAWIIFYEVGICQSNTYVDLWEWINIGNFQVRFGFQFDGLTSVMLVLVTTISALVHLYSTEYMNKDPHITRFMSYLSLFTFFMLILVTASNLLQLFIGWEGVGLCSYLLINYWYTRLQANKAGMKAMIVNRVGDVAIALALFTIYQIFKTIDFNTIFSLVHLYSTEQIIFCGLEIKAITLISILLFIGAVGKSAQLGLHTWLPDAMEGPTPVSALIHAATMVTAGVFLLIRCSHIIEYSSTGLILIVIVGSLTAFFAATVGVVQNDIKKVIAYSTCSQLGYMVFACGLSNYSTSIFHLFNHGFFKALLFLSAGSVIHAMADEQDLRKLGGIIKTIPFTYSMMLIGSLSLMGFPFLTGFYSKDAILELAYANYTFDGTFAHWLGTISAFFTAFYSFRLIYLTFITDVNAPQNTYKNAHESPINMSLPLLLLSIGAIFIGYLCKDMFMGMGTSFFGNSIFVLPANINLIQAEFLHALIKSIPVIFSLIGAVLSVYFYHKISPSLVTIKTSYIGKQLYTFFNNKW
jgi:NADH-ubiquinone oxidoreductase chain 5